MSETNSASETKSAAETPVHEQFAVRAAKRERLREEGWDPYPVSVPVTTTIAAVRERFGALEAGQMADENDPQSTVGVAGRVIFLRNTGRLCFVTLQDGAGVTLQAMLSAKAMPTQGHSSLAAFKADVDLGDHLFVHGQVGSSRRGELSVFAAPQLREGVEVAQASDDDVLVPAWRIASKALRPLPKTWTNEEGQTVTLSEEQRVRRRELDLIMRPAARDMVRIRAAVNRSIRENFYKRDYIELETPILQVIHGGAAARPFVTHMNAFDMDLYLRIATEIYLKRAVVGGVDRVFEMNRNFRNEGVDSSHSPEFAMLETYQAWGTYDDGAEMIKGLIQSVAREVFGSTTVTLADGTEYDLGGEWATMEMYPSLNEALQRKHPGQPEVTVDSTVEELKALADVVGVKVPENGGWGHGKLVEEIWEELCADQLYGPVFVRNFPVETSPLTRQHRTKRGVTEKWDLYIRGFELATGYSELVDPVIQRERFEDQARLAAGGDDEAMVLDEDFLAAMEQGMPPTAGTGMGIDRLLMALTGLGIRETVLFPIVKPEG